MKRSKSELVEDVEILKRAMKDILYMAVRYAHGRRSVAPHILADAYKAIRNRFPEDNPMLYEDPTLHDDDHSGCFVEGDDLRSLWKYNLIQRNP